MSWITILGLIAATLTATSFFPQVLKCWRTGQTKDISLPMYLIINTGFFLWIIYGFLISDLPLIAANIVAFLAASLILFFKLKNG
ncbi:MAG: SemiSWEET transporter [Patescibacteria group bacterium]